MKKILNHALLCSLFMMPLMGQPVWTDIINQTGQTNMASGTFWEFSNLLTSGYQQVAQTDIAAYPNLTIPGLGATLATSGGYQSSCSRSVATPTQFLESNQGTGIKGVGFLGTFGGAGIAPGNFGSGSFLFESVFFHEDVCYNGGREYGFFYDPYATGVANGNLVWAYWGTNENLSTVEQDNQPLGAYFNTAYYFEIYPTGNSSSCGFQVSIIDTGYNVVFSHSYSVSHTITNADSGFCAAVTGAETGYVSATTVYSPTITSISTSTNLNMQRVFVGK